MTTPINLTELRDYADSTREDKGLCVLQPRHLLALIDTAEAAIAFLGDWNGEDLDRLHETLTRYTTNQP